MYRTTCYTDRNSFINEVEYLSLHSLFFVDMIGEWLVMAASSNCKRKANISADDAVSENDNEEDEISLENDLFDLYGEVDKRIEETIQGIIDKDCKMYAQIKVTTIIEMKAFIGLMYYRGLYGQNNHRLDMLFSERHGAPVFSATMSRMRFQFILAHLCFDDYRSRDRRWPNDRFVAIREFFEQCNINFAKALVPEDYLSLDETLYPMRNQISFKQYNPDKPAKYGMLFKSINSGENRRENPMNIIFQGHSIT